MTLVVWIQCRSLTERKMKWNESGFRPPLCTYRLNWVKRTSWGWWDDWDDTVLQTQDSKFEPWRFEAEHATSRSRRLPTILTFTRGWGRNIFCFFETAETGNRTPNSGVKGSGANHYPRAPALDGKDGRSSHPSFSKQTFLLVLFSFWPTVFFKVEPPTTKLDQQTTNIYASMSLLYSDLVAYMPASHGGRWTNIEST